MSLLNIVTSHCSLSWLRVWGQSEEPTRGLSPGLVRDLLSLGACVAEVGQRGWGGFGGCRAQARHLHNAPPHLPACWTTAAPVTTSTAPAPASACRTKPRGVCCPGPEGPSPESWGALPHPACCLLPVTCLLWASVFPAVKWGALIPAQEGPAATAPFVRWLCPFSYRKAIYGPNVISVPVKSYLQLLVDEVGCPWAVSHL